MRIFLSQERLCLAYRFTQPVEFSLYRPQIPADNLTHRSRLAGLIRHIGIESQCGDVIREFVEVDHHHLQSKHPMNATAYSIHAALTMTSQSSRSSVSAGSQR